MEAKTLSKIAVRILAIYLIATGFMQIPNIVTILSNARSIDDEKIILFTFISVIITPIVVGFILWFMSEKLAKMIIGNESEIEVHPLHNPQLQTIIISTIDLTIVVLTIPELVRYIYQVVSITEVAWGKKGI